MSAPAGDSFSPESVELTWNEDGQPPVTARCWFEYAPIRHVVRKHVVSSEPWNRILDQRLLERLRANRNRLTGADCREFVKALNQQLLNCCSQPRLCRFQETEAINFDDAGDAAANLYSRPAVEKILFVLPSGGVAVARVEPANSRDTIVSVFLTAFLPRYPGWFTANRAAATMAARYVQRWARDYHPSGGLLLPEPDDAVTGKDDIDDRAVHRRWFRFITPKTWGFRMQKDGRLAWIAPHPGR